MLKKLLDVKKEKQVNNKLKVIFLEDIRKGVRKWLVKQIDN